MFKELELSETDSVLAAYNAVCDLVEETERLQAACAAKEAELAKAFANNILAGFAGEGEAVDAANAGESEGSRRRAEPIEMPDGTKCYMEECERHKEKSRQTIAI